MSAVSFLHNITTSKGTPIKDILKKKVPSIKYKVNYKKKVKLTEDVILNYSVSVHASRELCDILDVYADRGWVTKDLIMFFDKGIGNDMDWLTRQHKADKSLATYKVDFEEVVLLFDKYAEKSLSAFQMNSEPELVEILKAIYIIRFLFYSSVHVSINAGGTGIMPNKPFTFLNEKAPQLEKLFWERYSNVSNSTTFDFDQYLPSFKRIRYMTISEFYQYINTL